MSHTSFDETHAFPASMEQFATLEDHSYDDANLELVMAMRHLLTLKQMMVMMIMFGDDVNNAAGVAEKLVFASNNGHCMVC